MIEMFVSGMAIDPTNNMPIIILKNDDKKRTLPIWIGISEASSIAMKLVGVSSARPITHDIIKSVVEVCRAKILEVNIDSFNKNTFFAKIKIKLGRKSFLIDSRPSDAIALALRSETPILVDEKVIKQATIVNITEAEEKTKDFMGILTDLNREDFSKYKM
jgi:bifunctional DNase/RNase